MLTLCKVAAEEGGLGFRETQPVAPNTILLSLRKRGPSLFRGLWAPAFAGATRIFAKLADPC